MEKGYGGGAEEGKAKQSKPPARCGGVMKRIAKLLCFCGAPAEA